MTLRNGFVQIVISCCLLAGYSSVSVVKAQDKTIDREQEMNLKFSDPNVRMEDGDGTVEMSGELKRWHKVTLTLNGPFAHELDKEPNPFTDYKMTVRFSHESGSPVYEVPGYFAADGNAAETSADAGTKWRAHLSPDKTGEWTYEISFLRGEMAALIDIPWTRKLSPYDGLKGNFNISETDKTGRDLRSKGRLEYVGKNHLKFIGNNEYFLKAGPDSPETFLGYEDFDGTYTVFSQTWKVIVPLKKYEKHIPDWKEGDPTWQNGKGKGMIGALNYLSGKGLNAFSFLTYNAGGDGDNVWPFIKRDEKYHYDCSKLDQWGIVFDHAQAKGMYLHFKTQETEIDDNISRKMKFVIQSLDGGDLGPQRRLYCRELIARYAYLLALNWNMGEENTQSTKQLQDMSEYLAKTDPYKHNIVLHTYPGSQDQVYKPLLGSNSHLTGVSLQNAWNAVHKRTLQWINESNASKKPWIVANDEQNPALQGVPPDPGFGSYPPNKGYDIHDVRKQTLWGNIMAGGAGVEYYFGDIPPESDMQCENYRSREKSWTYCGIALDFIKTNNIPFWEMVNSNKLIGNPENSHEKYCFAKEGELYLVYLGYTPTTKLDLTNVSGTFTVNWYNPREGGALLNGRIKSVKGGKLVSLGTAPNNSKEDWIVIVKKSQ
jgi:hypothetical protein